MREMALRLAEDYSLVCSEIYVRIVHTDLMAEGWSVLLTRLDHMGYSIAKALENPYQEGDTVRYWHTGKDYKVVAVSGSSMEVESDENGYHKILRWYDCTLVRKS